MQGTFDHNIKPTELNSTHLRPYRTARTCSPRLPGGHCRALWPQCHVTCHWARHTSGRESSWWAGTETRSWCLAPLHFRCRIDACLHFYHDRYTHLTFYAQSTRQKSSEDGVWLPTSWQDNWKRLHTQSPHPKDCTPVRVWVQILSDRRSVQLRNATTTELLLFTNISFKIMQLHHDMMIHLPKIVRKSSHLLVIYTFDKTSAPGHDKARDFVAVRPSEST